MRCSRKEEPEMPPFQKQLYQRSSLFLPLSYEHKMYNLMLRSPTALSPVFSDKSPTSLARNPLYRDRSHSALNCSPVYRDPLSPVVPFSFRYPEVCSPGSPGSPTAAGNLSTYISAINRQEAMVPRSDVITPVDGTLGKSLMSVQKVSLFI